MKREVVSSIRYKPVTEAEQGQIHARLIHKKNHTAGVEGKEVEGWEARKHKV